MSSPKFLNDTGLERLWGKIKTAFVSKEELNDYHDDAKQDVLTAGDNITIEDNTISAKGGVEVIDTDNDTVIPLTLKIVDGQPVIEY